MKMQKQNTRNQNNIREPRACEQLLSRIFPCYRATADYAGTNVSGFRALHTTRGAKYRSLKDPVHICRQLRQWLHDRIPGRHCRVPQKTPIPECHNKKRGAVGQSNENSRQAWDTAIHFPTLAHCWMLLRHIRQRLLRNRSVSPQHLRRQSSIAKDLELQFEILLLCIICTNYLSRAWLSL